MFGRLNIDSDSSDEVLMKALGGGNRKALELLYDRYFDRLVQFAQRYLVDIQKSEDAVQEVFMRVIDKPGQYDPDRKFSTWIYTLTANACKNILRNDENRSRLIRENLGETLSFTGMHHRHDLSLLKRSLEKARGEFSEKEELIYLLRFERSMSIKEIAHIMSLPEGSVKSGIFYLLKKLARQLKEFNYGYSR